MVKRKGYSTKAIAAARKIYEWLDENNGKDRNVRRREEIVAKTGMNEDLFSEATSYLKRKRLITQTLGGYAIIKDISNGDFQQ